eukprot:1513524-Pleurochrysis_carterae.AAC.4
MHNLLGKTGFALFLPNRTTYLLQLQTLLLKANNDANELENGEWWPQHSSPRKCPKARSAGAGCAPTLATSRPRRSSRWR